MGPEPKTQGAYFYITDHVAIDADGALKAYHPDDVGKHCRNDPHIGLDCPANAEYPNTSWWQKALVLDPKNRRRAYIQPSGSAEGFLLSKTWLNDPDASETDPARYVDSTAVPYIVFPGDVYPQMKGTGWKGDAGFAINLNSGNSTAFIVADRGGGSGARLGEGSIALYEALGSKDPSPRKGLEKPIGENLFVVFPHFGKAAEHTWPRSQNEMAAQTDELISAAGGLEAMRNCAKAFSGEKTE